MKTNWKDFLPLICVVVILSFSLLINAAARWYRPGPEIVVYLDKDAKQPAILLLPTTTVVTGERAAFWWTVFNKAIERNNSTSDARYIASDALSAVYGPTK